MKMKIKHIKKIKQKNINQSVKKAFYINYLILHIGVYQILKEP